MEKVTITVDYHGKGKYSMTSSDETMNYNGSFSSVVKTMMTTLDEHTQTMYELRAQFNAHSHYDKDLRSCDPLIDLVTQHNNVVEQQTAAPVQ